MELLLCPDDVLLYILGQNALDVKDLFSLMVVCKSFYSTIQHSNELWKRKFYLRWPDLRSIQCPKELSWQDLVLFRIKTGAHVKKLLKELSPRCYADIEPPVAMKDNIITPNQTFQKIGRDIYLPFVEDELVDIIFDQNQDQHLTARYYAKKVLHYLRTTKLDKKWEEFLNRPTNEQTLIEGAVLVSQWGQMELAKLPDFPTVIKAIEKIVDQVKEKLKIMDPSSSFISNNPAEPRNARKILACINQVLYAELGFQGNIENYHSFENSYIDQVLKTRKGIPITLCILYHEVAKRLGVNCEPVSFPQHFLLRWKEFPEENEANQFSYIDAFNAGSSHLSHSCPALIGRSREEIRRDAYSAVLPAQVFQRMANNLMQSSRLLWDNGQGDDGILPTQLCFTRLACAINRRHPQLVVGYAELCVHLGTQLEEAIDLLQSAVAEDPSNDDPTTPVHWARIRQITSMKCANKLSYQRAQQAKRQGVHRNPSVKYAVGLIMRHKKYDYSCVIIFWDSTCQATEEWIQRMGVRTLVRGENQPFYHVLVDDGSYRYAAEENLELHPDGKAIDHPNIGIHFERYDGRRYIPNAEKVAHYPEDEEAAQVMLK